MSTRFHDKTVETADNPVYNVPLFFVNVFLCVFKSFDTTKPFLSNILSKRTLKQIPGAQNTFIGVTTR